MPFWRSRKQQSAPNASGGLTPQERELVERMSDAISGAMSDPSSELAQSVRSQQATNEAICDELVPQALAAGMTPQELYDQLHADPKLKSAAMMARGRLWEASLRAAEGAAFEAMCDEIEAMSESATHRAALFRVLDPERERRGLPSSPSKATRDNVEAAAWTRASEQLRAGVKDMTPSDFARDVLGIDPRTGRPPAD